MTPFKTTRRLLLLAVASAALLAPAAASAGPVDFDVPRSAASVRDYWTKARMRHADPVAVEPAAEQAPAPAPAEPGPPTYVPPATPGGPAAPELLRGKAAGTGTGTGSRIAAPVLDPSTPGTRTHGKVFFTIRKGLKPGDFVCSGTAVNSRNKSLVITAGHCVFDFREGGGKAKNWLFVPAYQSGARLFGTWPAKKLATTKQWKRTGNLRHDLGAAIVRRREGARLQTVVGARGIGFDQPRRQDYDIFGYPALDPFDGELPFHCASPSKGTDSPGGSGPNTVRASCDMTAGSSGGGWMAGRTLLSVTSYGYGNEPGIIYGPYLSKAAKKLYKRVRK